MRDAVRWIVALLFAFVAGWQTHALAVQEQTARNAEIATTALKLTTNTAGLAQTSLRYAEKYQQTLDICLARMGLSPAVIEDPTKEKK